MLTSMGTTLLATLASVAPVGDDAAHHGPMPIVDATRPTDLGWAGLILLSLGLVGERVGSDVVAVENVELHVMFD